MLLVLYAHRDYVEGGVSSLQKSRLLVVVFGGACGAVLCTVLEFFVFIPKYQGGSFFHYALLSWLSFFVVPAFFFMLFTLWSRDSAKTKAGSFLYFEFSFCSVYIPYLCFSNDAGVSFFMIFTAPILVAFALLAINKDVKVLFSSANPVRFVLSLASVLVQSAAVPVILTAWHFDVFFAFYLLGSVAWILFCVFRISFPDCPAPAI